MGPATIDLPGLPARPRNAPLDWAGLAGQLRNFLLNPANRVRFTPAEGDTAFTAFLEDKAYGTNRHELTSFGPVVLGLALLGEDVRPLAGSLRMFFDPAEQIFLNSPGQPRVEWWYLLNINALAAHLVRLTLADDESFLLRWRQAALRLVKLARRVDYDFNHQGYDFQAEAPWTDRDIYRQPDTVAAYAYQMLLAHTHFGDELFIAEAQAAIQRYLAVDKNPWYEIPMGAMGAAAAAYLRALGLPVDVEKAFRFALDPRASLVLGEWGGQEVNGLVRGWRHSAPESAYSMESLVLLPYLLPAARKIPGLARLVGKYALNTAANARLFYSGFTPHESRPDLSPLVAYERLYQEYEGQSPYAAGDFAGHKSIYGGGFALWWGALIRLTNDPFILQLDLARTDFLELRAYPTYLYYNPYSEEKTVQVEVGQEPSDLYDPTLHTSVAEGQTGAVSLVIPGGEARVVVIIPAKSKREVKDRRVEVEGITVDWGV